MSGQSSEPRGDHEPRRGHEPRMRPRVDRDARGNHDLDSVLPDRPGGDDPVFWGDPAEESDAWLRDQVPPHHGTP